MFQGEDQFDKTLVILCVAGLVLLVKYCAPIADAGSDRIQHELKKR